MTATIIYENGKYRYFDKNGVELHDGDTIVWNNGKVETAYLTEQDELGTDATNPIWIKNGRAEPCEYGIYPFTESDMAEVAKMEM